MMRRLHDLISRYWGRNVAPKLNDMGLLGAEPLSDRERLWNQLLRAKGCVKCDTLPKYFAEGPSGGMCTNVFCTHCGQGYNLTPIAHWAELIHRDERYVQKT
jgi:hypothetical protein